MNEFVGLFTSFLSPLRGADQAICANDRVFTRHVLQLVLRNSGLRQSHSLNGTTIMS